MKREDIKVIIGLIDRRIKESALRLSRGSGGIDAYMLHTQLRDMPSAVVADHDGRYYTESELSSVQIGKGASLIGIYDVDGLYVATNVEDALQEIIASGLVVTSLAEYGDGTLLRGDVKLIEGSGIIITRIDAYNGLEITISGGIGSHVLDPDSGPHIGTLLESNVADGTILARVADAETISADWLWNTDKKVQFRDNAIYIHSPSDGVLHLEADDSITFGTTFKPDAANTLDIGATDAEIANLYIGTRIYFGIAQDVDLFWSAANVLATNDRFLAAGGLTSEDDILVSALDKKIQFWGGATYDTELYRGADDLLTLGVGDSLRLPTTSKVEFRDAAIYIHSAADGYLDLVADTAIRLTSPIGVGAATPTDPSGRDGYINVSEDTGALVLGNATEGLKRWAVGSGGVSNEVFFIRRYSHLGVLELNPIKVDTDGNIGIRTANPVSPVTIKQSAGDVTGGIQLISSDVANAAGIFREDGASGALILRNEAVNTLAVVGGDVGVRVLSPQGLFHGYDTIGGFLYWEYNGVDGTARTVIPNGAGDVLYQLIAQYVVRDSGGGVKFSSTHVGLTPGNSTNIYDDGVDICTLAVAADGSVTVQRTAGAATFKVALWLLWL